MSPDRTPVTPELLADLRAHPPTSHLSPMPAPGLVDLSDVKAPGLVDREHIYDPPDGITYGCPTCAELLDRCAALEAEVELLEARIDADGDAVAAEITRRGALEGIVRELYLTMEHSGCDLRLVARAREMVPDEGPDEGPP